MRPTVQSYGMQMLYESAPTPCDLDNLVKGLEIRGCYYAGRCGGHCGDMGRAPAAEV